MAKGSVTLSCLDVFGNFIGERTDIIFKNQDLESENRRVDDKPAERALRIAGLRADTQNRYLMEVSAHSYKPVSKFINVKSSKSLEVSCTMPVNPAKVLAVTFPSFASLLPDAKALLQRSAGVLGFEGKTGDTLYDSLPDLSRAGFLNICAKCDRTRLSSGQTVLSQIDEVDEIRGDRFFAKVRKSLREETKNSSLAELFKEVSGALHHPKEGFKLVDSWKTPDSFANLQTTFFTDGTEWRADIDIDDRNGFAHFTQVVTNFFTGATHPYNIHQLLLSSQELDPGYRFQLGE